MFKIDPNFWQIVEDAANLTYVVYGDTDSLYINNHKESTTNINEAINTANQLAIEINNIITNFLNNYLLIKMNVSKNYNKTFFKTESVISNLMLLDAKKNYAYLELSKKNKIYDKPKVKYVGIPIVRSDYSKFAQDFIKFLINDVVFNINNYNSDKLFNIIENKQQELQIYLNELNFKYIATPGRWKSNTSYKSETFTVIGMRLYNTIVDQEIFRPGLNGLSIPIKIINEFKFKEELLNNMYKSKYYIGSIPTNKINYIVLPTNFEKELVRQQFLQYSISPNFDIIWKKTFGTVAKNITRLISEHFHNNF